MKGALRLNARGLGRLVFLFAGRRIKRGFDDGLARFWESSGEGTADLRRQLLELSRMIDDEGGEAAFVHRALWDADFDPTPPSARP